MTGRKKPMTDLPDHPDTKQPFTPIPVNEQIRDLRKARKITVSRLAQAIGRSTGYVSQVERGISAVSIPTLQKISEVLGVQISWFFQGNAVAPPEERDKIVRKENRRQLDLSRAGTVEELLSPNLRGNIELVLSTLEPGSTSGETSFRDTEEAGLLISGSLELWISDQHFVLEAGDSFRIDREDSYSWANNGSVDAVAVWVITPPTY